MTRTDDIINVAAHRLSTGEIEEVLAAHPDVAECAVIGVADAMKGQVPLGLLVLKAGVKRPLDEVEREAVALVRDRIGPVASFKTALVDISVAKLSPIAAEMKRLVQDPAYIDGVLADGSDRANAIASETIKAVKDVLGFIRH